jgi:hypothetical protein
MAEDNDVLLNAEPTGEKPVLNLKEYEDNLEDIQPDMHDPAWSDFVIRQFEPDEMFNGLPTTDGCRRIVNKLLGPIVESMPIIAQAPTPQNDNHATVVWKLVIRWDNNPLDLRTFGDGADVYIGNTHKEFAIHATASAATKAEGRALRKALQLKKVLTAEEMNEVPAEDPTKISKGQISFINMMCERNDINVMKLLGLSKLHKLQRIEDVPYATAVQISKYLNDCQNGKDSQGRKVDFPANIKGYDPNWRQVNEN